MTTVRVFIAHAKGDADDRLATLKDDISAALDRMSAGRKTVEVTLARDYYFAHSARLGSFEAYAREVAHGVHYLTREKNFDMIVLVDARLGAATQQIVKLALGIAKPVVLWQTGDFVKVTDVVQVSRDMKTGWLATLAA